nr:hypothetical protein [Tanacetum cinerariifolium]
NIIVGINIDDLTIEQYLWLTSENQTPSMVKKVDDITVNEYMKYEERMKSIANFNAIKSNIKFNYDSEDMELDEEAGENEQGTLRQWICFQDHERRMVKGSCMGFADFLQVHYGNQRIGGTTHERRYYEWVAQNYEFDNNRTSSTTTMSNNFPYKTNYPTPVLIEK